MSQDVTPLESVAYDPGADVVAHVDGGHHLLADHRPHPGDLLAGPPLLGHLGDRIGTLEVLLAVTALMVPASLSVLATRQPR